MMFGKWKIERARRKVEQAFEVNQAFQRGFEQGQQDPPDNVVRARADVERQIAAAEDRGYREAIGRVLSVLEPLQAGPRGDAGDRLVGLAAEVRAVREAEPRPVAFAEGALSTEGVPLEVLGQPGTEFFQGREGKVHVVDVGLEEAERGRSR